MTIRTYQDGDDFVVYFENCRPDMKDFLINMFKPVMEKDSMLEQAEKEPADPVIPDGCGRYSGKRVTEVLQNDGNRGYATIAYILGKGLFSNETDVRDILNEYLYDTFAGVDPQEYAGSFNEEGADEWIKCFDTLITANQKEKVVNITGFSSYEDFIKEGTLEQKIALIYNIIMNMGFHQ